MNLTRKLRSIVKASKQEAFSSAPHLKMLATFKISLPFM